MPLLQESDMRTVETQLLLEGVYRCYGFDFREYSRGSLDRRLQQCLRNEGLKTLSSLQDKVLHDSTCLDRLLLTLTVNTTAMFRDPRFYVAFREKVVPLLREHSFVRVWNAGCSTGEEAYSIAILLEEEGLYERCRIYATDMNEAVLESARAGVYPLTAMQEYTTNYQKAGGHTSFADYYTARYDRAVLHANLRKHILFAPHNLVTDSSFNEFHVILCRNVMIYFRRSLQARVHELLYASLPLDGILALGMKESLALTPREADYETLDATRKIYRKVH